MRCGCTDRYGFAKRVYATEAEALRHIRQDGIVPYRCPEGRGWHLTHVTLNDDLPSTVTSELDNTIDAFEAWMLGRDTDSTDEAPAPARGADRPSTQSYADKRQQLTRAYRSMIDDKHHKKGTS